jgi:hypothetical protein
MPEGDNPSLLDEFTNLLFFDSSIHIRILKQVPKYLATELNRNSYSVLLCRYLSPCDQYKWIFVDA